MDKRYFVDTNIFISLLIKRSGSFEECRDFFEKIKINKIKAVTGNVVLAELVWTLKSFYGISKKDVVKRLEGILQLRDLKIIDRYDLTKTVELFDRKPIKYIDAMIASIKSIQDRKWIVVSYDKDFDKLGVKRVEPGEV